MSVAANMFESMRAEAMSNPRISVTQVTRRQCLP